MKQRKQEQMKQRKQDLSNFSLGSLVAILVPTRIMIHRINVFIVSMAHPPRITNQMRRFEADIWNEFDQCVIMLECEYHFRAMLYADLGQIRQIETRLRRPFVIAPGLVNGLAQAYDLIAIVSVVKGDGPTFFTFCDIIPTMYNTFPIKLSRFEMATRSHNALTKLYLMIDQR